MTPQLQRRLPGVRFDVPAPVLDQALPRMDIAFFTGFAASGPLEVPVAVESLGEFEEVFGGEILLPARPDGSALRGLLHASLRQFFSHGGRRAWVLRVAGAQAQTTRFPLQCMLLLKRRASDEPWTVSPAWIAARSPGSWADGLSVSTRCDGQPLAVLPVSFDGRTLQVEARGPLALALAVDDTLQVTVRHGENVQGRVASLGPVGNDAATGRLFRPVALSSLASLRLDTRAALPAQLTWTEPDRHGNIVERHAAVSSGEWQAPDPSLGPQRRRLTLVCCLPVRARLAPGEVVRVALAGAAAPAWMALDSVVSTALGDASGQVEAQLSGRPWRVPAELAAGPLAAWVARADEATAQWLRADLAAALPAAAGSRIDGLALVSAAEGAASLFDLPDDAVFYTARGRAGTAGRASRAFEFEARDGSQQARPRFALASLPLDLGHEGEALMMQLETGPAPAAGLGARGLQLPALQRDGLASFDWRLFADLGLSMFHADALPGQAEAMRLFGQKPRPLRGLHALFGAAVDGPAEEPTLLAIPDAVQPRWRRKRHSEPPRRLHPQPPATAAEDSGRFADCALTPLPAPQFEPDADPDAAGNFTLRWTRPEQGVDFELQEAADIAFTVQTPAYAGPDTRLAVTGKSPGTQFYRVRARLGARLSGWSDVLEVRVGSSLYELLPWRDTDLLALHRLMLRAAAGRGDVLAVLSLPEHYRWSDAIAHSRSLRSSLATPGGDPDLPPPLGEDEARALSHGALYHPWVWTRRVDEVIACPPDGAVLGLLAARARSRGAWIAVANQPLKDVVALELAAGNADRQALLDAQLNPIVSTPAGFVAGSSDTLSPDPDWRAINVRRLMCLLRRAALERGATYVFEPNDGVLRRTVQRSFEALLNTLFQRGAFAGRSAAQAYRVELGDDINTEQRRDAGQLRVELKVAPSLPLSFLTVRLVRNGDRLSAQELR